MNNTGQRLAESGERTFDALIVGGGVNGAGIAFDLALRGLDVCLVDKADFAAGATAKSTRLIHGGLRYLEYMEFHLVFESLTEREVLLQNAPHLVKPLKLDLPTYETDKLSFLMKECGMALYDILSFSKSMPWHRVKTSGGLKKRGHKLNDEGLRGLSTYYDCQVEYPERLTIECLLSARANGAELFNYVEVRSLEKRGEAWEAKVAWAEEPERERVLKARTIVNAAGAWVDEVCERVEGGNDSRKMGGTKGSHLLVPLKAGAPDTALYVEARRDGRPFFIIPWRDYLLIGTTDLRYDGRLEDCAAGGDEIKYLIDETNFVAPGLKLTEKDVFMTYAGVRPLPYTPPGTKTGAITRRHIIYDHGRKDGRKGLYSIIGGKITTYRSLAAQTGDRIAADLRKGEGRSRTKEVPMYGGTKRTWPAARKKIVAELTEKSGLNARSTEHIADFYGMKAADVAELSKGDAALRESLTASHPMIAAQVEYALRVEMAQRVGDFFLRRSDLGYTPEHGLAVVEAVAERFAKHHGWSNERRDEEIREYEKTLKGEFFAPEAALPAGG